MDKDLIFDHGISYSLLIIKITSLEVGTISKLFSQIIDLHRVDKIIYYLSPWYKQIYKYLKKLIHLILCYKLLLRILIGNL